MNDKMSDNNNVNYKNYLYFTTPKDYHKEYYKKNRLAMKAKREAEKNTKLTQEVIDWKKTKLVDPYALFPFYEGPRGVFDISINATPSSLPTSTK